MPAYMIVVASITDRQRFLEDYAAAAATLVERFGGRYLLRARGAELLEGQFGDHASVVVSEWPDLETARRFWTSPEYADAKKRREHLAECQVLLVEARTAAPLS